MEEDQFLAAMQGENPTIEEIENIAIERKRRSDEENKNRHAENAKREELERERERLAKEALEANIKEGTIPDGTELRKTKESAEMGTSFAPVDEDPVTKDENPENPGEGDSE